eukprot:2964581-Alexandrium_andersonii.AAC.1
MCIRDSSGWSPTTRTCRVRSRWSTSRTQPPSRRTMRRRTSAARGSAWSASGRGSPWQRPPPLEEASGFAVSHAPVWA